jgi:hypothetical protein
MAVRSQNTSAKQSAIVSRATLDRQRGAFERLSAFVVLFFSFAGTIAALSGGWGALRSDPQLAPIFGGLALQGILTVVQWWYGAGRGVWRYRLSLCADSALTALGYGPLIVPWLGAYVATKGAGAAAEPLAWAAVGIVSMLVAWYPERQLID